MDRYGVIVGKSRVMSVYADSPEKAREKAEHQLDRPGRRGILRGWKEGGERVERVKQRKTQFKIKTEDDIGTPWKDLPVTVGQLCEGEDAANLRAAELAQRPGVYEVRWNWVGSLQGHYVPGTKRQV